MCDHKCVEGWEGGTGRSFLTKYLLEYLHDSLHRLCLGVQPVENISSR